MPTRSALSSAGSAAPENRGARLAPPAAPRPTPAIRRNAPRRLKVALVGEKGNLFMEPRRRAAEPRIRRSRLCGRSLVNPSEDRCHGRLGVGVRQTWVIGGRAAVGKDLAVCTCRSPANNSGPAALSGHRRTSNDSSESGRAVSLSPSATPAPATDAARWPLHATSSEWPPRRWRHCERAAPRRLATATWSCISRR